MASPLENDSGPHVTPDIAARIIDPLSFISLEIRRKIGYEWPDQVHSILYGLNLLSDRSSHLGTSAEHLVFISPKPKEEGVHEHSQAHYIFEGLLGKREVKDWIGVYVLLPGETTSEHEHPARLLEDYHVLRGEMTTQVLGEQSRIVRGGSDKFTIYPGQRHHSRTNGNQFALVMVRMIGASQFPRDQWHIGSRKPISPLDELG